MNLDALLGPAPAASSNGRLCRVGAILAGLEEPYRSALERLLSVPFLEGGETDEQLATRLRAAELPVGATTIRRHRTKTCIC